MSDRVGDLEIGQDLVCHRCAWQIERGSWILILLIILAALAGFFGNGPASERTAGRIGNEYFWAKYNRFERYQADGEIKIHLPPGSDEAARLTINKAFHDLMGEQQVYPAPVQVANDAETFTYTFARKQGSAVDVTLRFKPRDWGNFIVRLATPANGSLEFKQLYYP